MKDIYTVEHKFTNKELEKVMNEIGLMDLMPYMTTLESTPYQSITHFGVKTFGIDFNDNIVNVAICTLLGKLMMAIPTVCDGRNSYIWVDR